MDAQQLLDTALADTPSSDGKQTPDFFTPEQEFKRLEAAAISLISTKRYIGQAILMALWRIYENGGYEVIAGFETLRDWAEETLVKVDDDEGTNGRAYILELVLIVERIFSVVHQRHVEGRPFKVGDTAVTVEQLLCKNGLVSKLKIMSDLFSGNKPEVQQEIMTAILTQTRDQVKTTHATITKSKTPIKIPYQARSFNDRWVVTMQLDENQYKLLKSLLGVAGDELL
jgi:hypothetical protein